MDGEKWKRWNGKKVFIILKNKRNYAGVIQDVETTEHLVWISLIDKFGNEVMFSVDEIDVMEEET